MPHKPREFVNGEIYHIVLRRVGEKKLFRDINDYFRGIFCLYEFNNANPVVIRRRRDARVKFKRYIERLKETQSSVSEKLIEKDNRDLLVEILGFSFMPNHIHLLLRQSEEGEISRFMLKMESGYAAYFNNRYKLKIKGHFFQDRFTSVHIKTEEQLKTVFVYIHANPISLIEPRWKEKGIKNPSKVVKFLEERYRWSSFFDYIGKKNFPSVTSRDFLLEIMGGDKGCRKAVEDWVKYKKEIRKFKNLSLE